jgi:pyruvate dehydrogenase (quinone)
VIPRDEDLQHAAHILNAGNRVAMLIGAGALHALEEVIEVAGLLGAGVAKAFLGKAALPDDLPFVTGAIGLFGTTASHEMMSGCDTLLMVGSSFPYAEFLPPEGQARGVQIDIDGRMLGIRYPMECNLTGDSAETLRALIPLLKHKEDRSWQQQIERHVTEWWGHVEGWARKEATPLNPRVVFHELSPRLPDDCILTADSGSSSTWTAQHLKMRQGMQFSVSGTLASMGCAVPYAIAAKFAYPHRVVFAFAGDGAMQMNGNEELLTIAKYWRQWQDPRLIVLVLNNRDLNFVTWEQRLMQGEPKYAASQELPDFNYAAYAESLGLRGIRVDNPAHVASAWEEALSADRPVVLEAVTDPEVVIFTPQVAAQFAPKLAQAMQQGDYEAGLHLDDPLDDALQKAAREMLAKSPAPKPGS